MRENGEGDTMRTILLAGVFAAAMALPAGAKPADQSNPASSSAQASPADQSAMPATKHKHKAHHMAHHRGHMKSASSTSNQQEVAETQQLNEQELQKTEAAQPTTTGSQSGMSGQTAPGTATTPLASGPQSGTSNPSPQGSSTPQP
jgi:hypothetical protein